MNHTAQARARPGLAQLHIGRRSTTAVVLQCLCIVERSPGRLDLLSHPTPITQNSAKNNSVSIFSTLSMASNGEF